MRNYNFNVILSFLIIILSIISYSSQLNFTSAQNHLTKEDYHISFDLSGDITIIGTAKLIVSGSLSIDTVYDLQNNFWSYSVKYIASIPNGNLEGITIIKENDTNKKLVYKNIESGVIGIAWNLFSNNSRNDVYSIFRITPSEIQNREFQLLNYSAKNINDFNLFSPKLSKSLKTHKISFQNSGEQKFDLFFDITQLRLVGFNIKLSQTLNRTRYLINMNAVVSEVDYYLAKAKLETVFVIINSLISGSIIIIIIIMIRSKYGSSNKIAVKGGLSSDR